jgi:hypothetical protein
MVKDCDRLLGAGGESISISLTADILACHARFDAASCAAFHDALATRYNPDAAALAAAAAQWGKSGAPQDLVRLVRAAESPRQELLRRANGFGVICGAIGSVIITSAVKLYTDIHWAGYIPIAILSCIVLGYLCSFLSPPRRNLDGLTVFTARHPAA